MVKILKRKIAQSEAELLIKEIKRTPNIIGYSLKNWLEAEHIMVAEDEKGNLIGACLNYDFHKNWNKIAALIVLDEFKGRGIGKTLFYESFKDARKRKKNVYTISANPIVIKMMKDLGFVRVKSFFELNRVCQKNKFLFYWHTLQWVVNLYRLQEIIRKTIVHKSEKTFVFGVKFSD